MKILLDAMGGDNAPDAVIRGAVSAINEVSAEVCLIGQEHVLNAKIKEFYGKDLSEISNRGATLLVGRIRGIDRPALAGILPAYHGRLVLMDCGANTNCKPLNLLQFAQMASLYMTNTLNVKKPKIGLLNIGTEETKGNDLIKSSYQLLKKYSEELDINFIGNVEGREAFLGDVDVVIADGFTGNIFLKTVEGLGKFVKTSLTESFKRNPLTMVSGLIAKPALNKFAKSMDYKEYGGALFLGVNKPVVKAHGSSDEKLFKYTIKQAEQFVKNEAVDRLASIYESEENKIKMAEIKQFLAEQ